MSSPGVTEDMEDLSYARDRAYANHAEEKSVLQGWQEAAGCVACLAADAFIAGNDDEARSLRALSAVIIDKGRGACDARIEDALGRAAAADRAYTAANEALGVSE